MSEKLEARAGHRTQALIGKLIQHAQSDSDTLWSEYGIDDYVVVSVAMTLNNVIVPLT